jgi:hypothetical protein
VSRSTAGVECRFPAAIAPTEYELMTGKEIVSIVRRRQLDARIALTLTPIGSKATRVSITTRYMLSGTMLIGHTQDRLQTTSHLIRFTSDRGDAFPGVVACWPTGRLEADVVSVFAPSCGAERPPFTCVAAVVATARECAVAP